MPERNSNITFNRLPKSLLPKHYDILLKPNLVNFEFHGEVSIQVEVKEAVNKIVLNAFQLVIQKAEFTDNLAKSQIAENIELNEQDQTCVITFEERFALGNGKLYIQFLGELNDSMKGFYRSKYTTPQGEERYAAVSQLEATDARRAFPCWDEPALKATFGVTLVVPKDRVALSNMNPISEIPYPANINLRQIKYSNTPIMSTYLLAFVVGEFDYVETISSDGINVRVYTPLGKKEQGAFALEVAPKVLTFFKNYFNIPYSLSKLDLVAIPDFAFAAMENWGLITYREVCLLADAQNTSQEIKQSIAVVIAHEIAHQWFGNLVTMEWWTHLWLNEGFASFMQYLSVDNIFPEYHIWSNFLDRNYNQALKLDVLNNSHPIEVPIYHPDEISEIFDTISYCKGSSVIRMLHRFIGDECFRKGMHQYLKKHAYANASTEDLWASLEEASGKPVTSVMRMWTEQKGFPVISVSSKPDGPNQILTLSQEKLTEGAFSMDECNSLWMVPIDIITSSTIKTPKQILLDCKSTEVVIEGVTENDWIKLNPNIVGFYRVHYTEEMMSRLLPALKNGSLPLLDRLGVQSDVFALVKSGKTSTVDALKLMEEYTSESDYSVWNSLADCLDTLAVIISHTDFDHLFHKYCQKFFAKIHSRLGWDSIEGESHLDKLLRNLVLLRLIHAKDKGVLVEAKKRFKAHTKGTSILPADLCKAVYEAAVVDGDDEIFQCLIKMHKETDLQEEKNRITGALASVIDPVKIRQVLDFSLSSEVRSQDTVNFIRLVSLTKPGREMAWSFFQEKADEFRDRYKEGFLLNSLVKGVTINFASEEKALEIESFFSKNAFQGIDRALLQSLETVRLYSKWLARDRDALKSYLEENSC